MCSALGARPLTRTRWRPAMRRGPVGFPPAGGWVRSDVHQTRSTPGSNSANSWRNLQVQARVRPCLGELRLPFGHFRATLGVCTYLHMFPPRSCLHVRGGPRCRRPRCQSCTSLDALHREEAEHASRERERESDVQTQPRFERGRFCPKFGRSQPRLGLI